MQAIGHVQATVNADIVNPAFRADVAWGGTVDVGAAVAYTP